MITNLTTIVVTVTICISLMSLALLFYYFNLQSKEADYAIDYFDDLIKKAKEGQTKADNITDKQVYIAYEKAFKEAKRVIKNQFKLFG